MKLRRITAPLLVLFVTLISACSPSIAMTNISPMPSEAINQTPQPATQVIEATRTPTIHPTATATHSPTKTVQPTKTITPTREPTSTATLIPGSRTYRQTFPAFSPQQLQTATQSPAAICPETTLTDTIPLTFSWRNRCSDETMIPSTAEEVLSFLNAHGAESLLGKNLANECTYDDEPVIGNLDLTNDGVNELILEHAGSLLIYGCINRAYQLLFSESDENQLSPAKILNIHDINLNGVPEIYLEVNTLTQAGRDLDGIEWNGKEFAWLLGDGYGIDVAPGYLSYEDIDRDGMKEVIVNSLIPIFALYSDGLPWRNAREVYKWDGERFRFYREILDPPEFRFQAVQDGDWAVYSGDYEQALDFYWTAINSETLMWFSEGRRDTMRAQWAYQHWSQQPNPTLPAPDPLEYNYLAAYSYFKIIAIHTLLGQTSQAAQVMDTLRINYPEGKAGSIYKQIAETFLQAYQESNHIDTACDLALSFVEENWKEATRYLGNVKDIHHYHGWQSLYYRKHDRLICPFTDESIP